MGFDLKRILISTGIFAGVLLVMCFAAKSVFHASAGLETGSVASGSGVETDSADIGDTPLISDIPDESGDIAKTDPPAAETDDPDESEVVIIDINTPLDNIFGPDDPLTGTEDTPDAVEVIPVRSGEEQAKVHTVCIDAAHQAKADVGKEPVGPGADAVRIRCNTGGTGVSGALEYELNLAIALKLKEVLTDRGYSIVMIRETNDVSVSDSERAKIANESSELAVHIHCNVDDREGIYGVMCFEPSGESPYIGDDLRNECNKLGKAISDSIAAATGTKNWGVIGNDLLTAINWTTIPAAHVETGYITNTEEEKKLRDPEYQRVLAEAVADGIDAYFDHTGEQ